MPNFNFKSQFPIADVIAAAQRKPQIEAQMKAEQEQARQARFKTLLDALSTGAQVSRLVTQNKTDSLAQQQTQSQMTGQKDLQSILAEPQPQAPVAAPIQQFKPTPTMGPPTADGAMPPPVLQPSGVAQPTFGQTPQGMSQPSRLNAAMVQAFPQAAGEAMTKTAFGDPLDRKLKETQIGNIGVDNQLAATKILDERAKTAASQGVDQAKLDIDRQKLVLEREKLKMDALNNGGKLTDQQANGLLFGQRAAEAHQQLQDLIDKGFDPASKKTGIQSYAPNLMQPEDVQLLQQSKLNFISAVLRKESGAAISNSEIKNAERQYFPVAGDGDKVLAQKKKNRDTAIQGLFRSAGKQGEESLAKYRATSSGGGLPSVGSIFNGGTVTSVERLPD